MSSQIIQGDALAELRKLPDASIHCCVTSPPYYGLRDYGTARWKGGDPACDHVADAGATKKFGNAKFNENRPSREATKTKDYYFKDVCGKCDARRIDDQIGLEDTPNAYAMRLVEVFREMRRVLRGDGTFWLNVGDSSAGSGAVAGGDWKQSNTGSGGKWRGGKESTSRRHYPPNGLKPKDLIGIPWLLAFALRADGWYLRSDIIWAKPNPMPESVTDRPTKSHEHLFLFSKNERYHYDANAIAENAIQAGRVREDVVGGIAWEERNHHSEGGKFIGSDKRNKRDVWTVASQPYAAAHFAMFPPKLIEPCVLAGCPQGGTVLDPFAGSGTTGQVASMHGRNAVLIELNSKNVEIMKERLWNKAGLLDMIEH